MIFFFLAFTNEGRKSFFHTKELLLITFLGIWKIMSLNRCQITTKATFHRNWKIYTGKLSVFGSCIRTGGLLLEGFSASEIWGLPGFSPELIFEILYVIFSNLLT